MKTVQITGTSGTSRILVGERIDSLDHYLPGERRLFLTDQNVYTLYRDRFPEGPAIVINDGEENKTLDTVSDVYQQMIEIGVDRSWVLVGIGGGIVCDVAGFVASTFMRGIRFGFVASTLLAQVDASVGGKNGVNFLGYKNMVGVFNQPGFVICDSEMLNTLPRKEIRNGFAEIVKHAVLADETMFTFIEKNIGGAIALETDVIEYLVQRSVEIKAAVVDRDEREHGERRKLNLGHTFGHALEKIYRISHGEAVSIGMVKAANLAVRMGLLADETARRIKSLLAQLGLPTEFAFDLKATLDAMGKDKKREGEHIHFVLPTRIGNSTVVSLELRAVGDLLGNSQGEVK